MGAPYTNVPSPTSATIVRSGDARRTPTAAPRAQPRLAPALTRNSPASVRGNTSCTLGRLVTVSSRTIASGGSISAMHRTSHSGVIGLVSAKPRSSASSRRAFEAWSATSDDVRSRAPRVRSAFETRPTASTRAGSAFTESAWTTMSLGNDHIGMDSLIVSRSIRAIRAPGAG